MRKENLAVGFERLNYMRSIGSVLNQTPVLLNTKLIPVVGVVIGGTANHLFVKRMADCVKKSQG